MLMPETIFEFLEEGEAQGGRDCDRLVFELWDGEMVVDARVTGACDGSVSAAIVILQVDEPLRTGLFPNYRGKGDDPTERNREAKMKACGWLADRLNQLARGTDLAEGRTTTIVITR